MRAESLGLHFLPGPCEENCAQFGDTCGGECTNRDVGFLLYCLAETTMT
jgi:hypothetical protein